MYIYKRLSLYKYNFMPNTLLWTWSAGNLAGGGTDSGYYDKPILKNSFDFHSLDLTLDPYIRPRLSLPIQCITLKRVTLQVNPPHASISTAPTRTSSTHSLQNEY